jgi:hypothetical protein
VREKEKEMATEKNSQMREEIITALGAWVESLEVKVKEQNTLQSADTIVGQVMVEFGTLCGALVIQLAEKRPNLVDYPVWAKSVVKTLFETVTEEIFTAGAIKGIVDKERYYQNLVSNPKIVETAKKYGLPAQSVARDLANDTANQSTEAIRSIAPLVIKIAQEPWSVAALEERLTKAIPTAKGQGQTIPVVAKEKKVENPAQKKKWWQIR